MKQEWRGDWKGKGEEEREEGAEGAEGIGKEGE